MLALVKNLVNSGTDVPNKERWELSAQDFWACL